MTSYYFLVSAFFRVRSEKLMKKTFIVVIQKWINLSYMEEFKYAITVQKNKYFSN